MTFTTPKYAQKYKAKGNCLYEIIPGKSGTVERKLCNLVPEILCEITVDDGAVTTTYVRLRGVHESGRILPEIEIPAAELASFNWMPERWGMDCILEVGKTVKDCVRHAIQTTAAYAEKKTVYQVTGWRKIGEDWHYLMPGDAEQTVILPGKLQGYGMERTCEQRDIQTAACMLQRMPAPEEVMFPLLAFTFLSPLNQFLKEAGCEPKFVLFLSGKTGSRKSTLAALMLSFFGKFTASELPLSFRDTANSILHNAFTLKDVLTVIDDLHPGSRMEEQRMKGTAQAIMRAYGDRTGRGRLRSDSTLMESRPPQGNAIITAEYAPDIGESGTARYFALELKEDDVDLQTLSVYQKEAAQGTLQRCMYAYTQWLKERFLYSEEARQEFLQRLHSRFLFYRDAFRRSGSRCHGRVPETVAHLQMGMDFFLMFLRDRNGMDEESCVEIQMRFRQILYRAAWVNFSASASSSSLRVSSTLPRTSSLSCPLITSSFSCTIFSDMVCSPFRMVCHDFILPEGCKPCLLLSSFQFCETYSTLSAISIAKQTPGIQGSTNELNNSLPLFSCKNIRWYPVTILLKCRQI